MAPVLLTILAATLGAVLVLLGVLGPSRTPGAPRRRRSTRSSSMSRKTQVRLLISVGVGLILAFATGWVILVAAVPLIVVGLPFLLNNDDEKRIAKLDALETWTRSLAGLTVTGQGLERTIAASRESCPDAIREEVTRLVARLNSRMSTEKALRMFADELDDETADFVVAHLILKATQRGNGLNAALQDLAESILSEVRARRQIETERSGPRNETRIVVFITLGLLGLLVIAQQYSAPYGTPLGQLLLCLYLGIDVLLLVMMRRIGKAKPGPRVLAVSEKGAGA